MTQTNFIDKVGSQSGKIESTENISASLINRSKSKFSSGNVLTSGNPISNAVSLPKILKMVLERSFSAKISVNPIIKESKVKEFDSFKSGVEKIESNKTTTSENVEVKKINTTDKVTTDNEKITESSKIKISKTEPLTFREKVSELVESKLEKDLLKLTYKKSEDQIRNHKIKEFSNEFISESMTEFKVDSKNFDQSLNSIFDKVKNLIIKNPDGEFAWSLSSLDKNAGQRYHAIEKHPYNFR